MFFSLLEKEDFSFLTCISLRVLQIEIFCLFFVWNSRRNDFLILLFLFIWKIKTKKIILSLFIEKKINEADQTLLYAAKNSDKNKCTFISETLFCFPMNIVIIKKKVQNQCIYSGKTVFYICFCSKKSLEVDSLKN